VLRLTEPRSFGCGGSRAVMICGFAASSTPGFGFNQAPEWRLFFTVSCIILRPDETTTVDI
jgi:hypothetical protein